MADGKAVLYLRLAGGPFGLTRINPAISRLALLNFISFLSTRSQLMLRLLKSLLPERIGTGMLLTLNEDCLSLGGHDSQKRSRPFEKLRQETGSSFSGQPCELMQPRPTS
jgi:hypothetical protein